MPYQTFEDFVARVPIAHQHGYREVARTEDSVTLACSVLPEMLQTEDWVHGGVLSTLADSAAVWLLYPGVPDDRALTSIEFKLNFLRPALGDAGDLVATARLVRRGRTISLCDVEVSQDERLVAKGLFTYLVYRRARN